MTDPATLSAPAAAKYIGVSPDTLRRWADERKIRHVRLPSGKLRFERSDLDEVLKPVEPAFPGTSPADASAR